MWSTFPTTSHSKIYFSLDAKHLNCHKKFSSGMVRNALLTLHWVCDPCLLSDCRCDAGIGRSARGEPRTARCLHDLRAFLHHLRYQLDLHACSHGLWLLHHKAPNQGNFSGEWRRHSTKGKICFLNLMTGDRPIPDSQKKTVHVLTGANKFLFLENVSRFESPLNLDQRLDGFVFVLCLFHPLLFESWKRTTEKCREMIVA